MTQPFRKIPSKSLIGPCMVLVCVIGCGRTTDQSSGTPVAVESKPAKNTNTNATNAPLADDSIWKVHESKESGFKISFPGDPQITGQSETGGNYLVAVGDIQFRLVYMKLRTKLVDLSTEALEPHLKAARDGVIKAAKGTLVSSEIIEVDGLPRLSLSYEVPNSGSLSYGQYSIDGTRIFGFFVTGPKDAINKSFVDRYLNSFTLTSPPKLPKRYATADEFFKVIDDVKLVEQEVTWQQEEFVISAPMDATIEPLKFVDAQFKLNLVTGEAVEFLVGEWDMNERRRTMRSSGRFSKKPLKGFAYSDDETLIFEKGDGQFGGYLNLTLGPRQFCARLKSSSDNLFDHSTCALLLKCAKSLKLKTLCPTDPIEIAKRLGVEIETVEDDPQTVIGLSFPNNTSPKMVELVKHFPKLESVKVAVVWNSTDFLLPLTKCPNLKRLEIPKNIGSSTKSNDTEMKNIAQCVGLQQLNISVSSVKPENLNHLQNLKHLATLDLRDVRDESKIKAFAESVPNVNVRIHSQGRVTWESKPE